MKSFIIYNVDGIIIRTGSCVDSDFDIQAGDGEFVMEGIADDLCHMILDGQIVDKPEIIVSDYEIKAEVAALLRSKATKKLNMTANCIQLQTCSTPSKKDITESSDVCMGVNRDPRYP